MSKDLLGKTIGGYELTSEIGMGDKTAVYKAYQPHLERWVAVKVLPHQAGQALATFKEKAQAISHLRHRNIVIIYDYGEQDGQPYIVMEYVEGGTLANYIATGPLDWIKAVDLLIPVAEALAHSHDKGIIHGNIRASNILVPRDNWPLLSDFSLSKMEGPLTIKPDTTARSVAYVAPECIPNQRVDHRLDMYAMGAVLFEMITGRVPFNSDNPGDVLKAHSTASIPPLRQFNPQCPPILELIISTAMQKLPDQRYLNMARMVVALKDALASSDVRPVFYKAAARSTSSFKTDFLDSAQLAPVLSTTPPATATTPGTARFFVIEQQTSIPIPDKDNLIIGRTHRDQIADIDLGPHGAAKSGLSRRHARLTRQNGGWVIDDLKSLNGTFVNNVRLQPETPTPLKNGDEVRCGQMALLFLTSADS